MSLYGGNHDLADLLPAYYCNNIRLDRRSVWRGICTHLIAMGCAIALCAGGFYYYQNFHTFYETDTVSRNDAPSVRNLDKKEDFRNVLKQIDSNYLIIGAIKNDVNILRQQIESIGSWRTNLEKSLTSTKNERTNDDVDIAKMIEDAINVFNSDEIGLMDHAAYYAGGSIAKISDNTDPYPTHRPLSLFSLVQVNVLSSPEEILRPCTLPGSCFAFKGSTAMIRVRLAGRINVGAVTLGHASRLLLGSDGMASAPKDFEIYGFEDDFDDRGTFMGAFVYNSTWKQHQMFPIQQNLIKNKLFELVELRVFSNYGKNFTCIYRFRVHSMGDIEKNSSNKNCC